LIAVLGDKCSKQRLVTVKGHQQTWIRLYTGIARLRLGESVAVPELMRDFDNLPVDWLDSAIFVFSTVKEAAARKLLQPELEKRSKAPDLEPAMASAAILLSWDPEQGFFRMLDGLSSKSTEERELAYYYLANDDSKKLTFVMRRALSREQRPFTRDQLRVILDDRS
ncbi:MAG: hypothetical protein AB7K71_38450, partial [Polyangiaceae bacterium]